MKEKIPFEIHITIDDLSLVRQGTFIDFCKEYQGKPLFIELHTGDFIKQPMFNKIIYSNNFEEIINAVADISQLLLTQNFIPKRVKIEIPSEFHTNASNITTNSETYFEWHCKIKYEKIEKLLALCEKHKVHLSKNSLRNENNIRFITLRESHSKSTFEKRINSLKKELIEGKWLILKEQFEFCIYDNNMILDNGWLPN
ncbi:hypothetical protein [Flavobacterium sp.]|uniref:hypothetical protein n=1 Tax=Flavobacterium sp. TaxID=239 RepID=UPI003D1432A8